MDDGGVFTRLRRQSAIGPDGILRPAEVLPRAKLASRSSAVERLEGGTVDHSGRENSRHTPPGRRLGQARFSSVAY